MVGDGDLVRYTVEVEDGLPFDPVPGTSSRPLDFDYALTCNYQIGGVKSVILVGSPDAV